jgi:hypothetical protein
VEIWIAHRRARGKDSPVPRSGCFRRHHPPCRLERGRRRAGFEPSGGGSAPTGVRNCGTRLASQSPPLGLGSVDSMDTRSKSRTGGSLVRVCFFADTGQWRWVRGERGHPRTDHREVLLGLWRRRGGRVGTHAGPVWP